MTRLLSTVLAAIGVAACAAACGTQHVHVPLAQSDPTYAQNLYAAHLFQQRCAGCHTFSYAATHGSAANVRTAEAINGPNFDFRCERPVTRVLYAIENGGFSGAYMPANVVVGQDARLVANFVARFSGRSPPHEPLQVACADQPIGTLPPPLPGQ